LCRAVTFYDTEEERKLDFPAEQFDRLSKAKLTKSCGANRALLIADIAMEVEKKWRE